MLQVCGDEEDILNRGKLNCAKIHFCFKLKKPISLILIVIE